MMKLPLSRVIDGSGATLFNPLDVAALESAYALLLKRCEEAEWLIAPPSTRDVPMYAEWVAAKRAHEADEGLMPVEPCAQRAFTHCFGTDVLNGVAASICAFCHGTGRDAKEGK